MGNHTTPLDKNNLVLLSVRESLWVVRGRFWKDFGGRLWGHA